MLRVVLIAILLIVVARLVWRLFDAVIDGARGGTPRRPTAAAVKLVRDPVCGTFVAPNAALSLGAGGGTQYFCSEECRSKFQS